jgi:hypothetical protein
VLIIKHDLLLDVSPSEAMVLLSGTKFIDENGDVIAGVSAISGTRAQKLV